ncbi:MAG: hypothetical protein AB2A00_19100 [Myxococcota bacterium]
MTDVSRLAASLLQSALRTFRLVPDEKRGPALEALDSFLAAPGPLTFLRASRVVNELGRTALLARLGSAGMERSLARGLETLAKVPEMDPAVTERLRALPVDPRAGRRLEALAALIITHQELASRAEAASSKLRRQMEKMKARRSSAPPKGAPPRSIPPKSATPRRKSTAEAGR